jgi:hypothetical protein
VRLLKTVSGIIPYLGNSPFWEFDSDDFVGTTTVTKLVMDPLMLSTGLLAAYPQHAAGYFNGTNFRLRQKIIVKRIEVRTYVTGSSATLITNGDAFNRLRFALYKVGAAYSDSTEQYLGNGIYGGTDIDDIKRVYIDKTYNLSTTAFLSNTSYNVPCTRSDCWTIHCHEVFNVYSTTPTGMGAAWNTVKECFRADITSDSSVTPNPEIRLSLRFFFEFSNSK